MDYTALFSDGIGDLLERLDDEKEGDIMDELLDEYDMPALMDMRLRVFRYAKCKLVSNLDGPGNVDMGPSMSTLISPEHYSDAQGIVDEWILLARRGKQKVVKDTLDLMGFMSGRHTFFPHAVVKRSKAKTKKKGVARCLSRDPNQPKISFNVLEDEMDENEGSQDESCGEVGTESDSSSEDSV